MDLVVHEVVQLEKVHEADGGALLEGLAGAAVVQLDLPAAGHVGEQFARVGPRAGLLVLFEPGGDVHVGLIDGLVDLILGGAVEDGCDSLEAEHTGRPPEVGFEDLPDVHSAGDAQRVEQHVHRRAVLHERHVLLGDDARDDALVAVSAGHLVARGELPLGRDIDLDHLEHAGGQLVAPLHVRELAELLGLDGLDAWPELRADCLGPLASVLGALGPLDVVGLDLLEDDLGDIAGADLLAGHRVDHLDPDDLVDGLGHLLEQVDGRGVHLRLERHHVVAELLLLQLGHVHSA